MLAAVVFRRPHDIIPYPVNLMFYGLLTRYPSESTVQSFIFQIFRFRLLQVNGGAVVQNVFRKSFNNLKANLILVALILYLSYLYSLLILGSFFLILSPWKMCILANEKRGAIAWGEVPTERMHNEEPLQILDHVQPRYLLVLVHIITYASSIIARCVFWPEVKNLKTLSRKVEALFGWYIWILSFFRVFSIRPALGLLMMTKQPPMKHFYLP